MNNDRSNNNVVIIMLIIIGGLFLYMQYSENQKADEFREQQLHQQQLQLEEQENRNKAAIEKECERVRSLCTNPNYHYKIIIGEIEDDGTCNYSNISRCAK